VYEEEDEDMAVADDDNVGGLIGDNDEESDFDQDEDIDVGEMELAGH
jgi:phosphopantothenoylcysteine synthetase/decarboxylase